MRILIVDDERPARAKLARMLALQAAEFGISAIREAVDGVQALDMLEASKPDVLFLDIHMPEISGLELAASLPSGAAHAMPLIVFVTAFDQYALQAFDADAIDYLLKPYDQARLQRALQRVHARWCARQRMRAHAGTSAMSDPGDPSDPSDPSGMSGMSGAAGPARISPSALALPAVACGQPLRQLLISERGQTRVVKLEQIEWIETADNYVILHCAREQPLLRQTLCGLLANLGPAFVRCHRRAAVRISLVERVLALEKGDAQLLLTSGARVPCSRQYRAAVMAALAPG